MAVAKRTAVPKKLRETPNTHVGLYKVVKTSLRDGTKLYLENDNWVLLRFSGTEPVRRLAVAAGSPQKAQELLDRLKKFVRM